MVNFYGFVYTISFITIFFILKEFFKKEGKKDLIYSFMIYSILGTIVGARIVHVIYYNPIFFFNNPIKILKFWEGGLSFHGGLIGIIFVIYFFSKINKINPFDISDLIVIPVSFFLGLGRIANFTNNELYGRITDVPWCIEFKNVFGCRHPTQIYSAINDFFIFFLLLFLKRSKLKKGVLSMVFLFVYSILRIFVDFFREYDTYYFGLSNSQYLNIITLLISGIILAYLLKKN